MVTIATDQEVFGQPDYRVVAGGDYAPEAKVNVYRVGDPTQIVAFHALYISTGVNP